MCAMSWEGHLKKSLVQKGRRELKKFGNRWAIGYPIGLLRGRYKFETHSF